MRIKRNDESTSIRETRRRTRAKVRERTRALRLLELLLHAQIVRVATLLLAAVCGARRKARIAFAANLLVAIVFHRELTQRRLDDAAAEAEDEVERRLLLDIVVTECAAILQLLARED